MLNSVWHFETLTIGKLVTAPAYLFRLQSSPGRWEHVSVAFESCQGDLTETPLHHGKLYSSMLQLTFTRHTRINEYVSDMGGSK